MLKHLKTMNKLTTTLVFILFAILTIYSQTLTLDSCQQKARKLYPLIKQYDLIEKTSQYNLSNANKAYLPQINASLKASYQSDITEIPAILSETLSKIAGRSVTFPSLGKDQYQALLEVQQVIWDGGTISAQKKAVKATAEADRQKLEVDLYTLNDRINNLYFGILLINEQLTLNDILKKDLLDNLKRISAMLENGIAQQSDLDAIKVEQVNANQRECDLKATRKSYLQILSAFINLNLNEKTPLIKPQLPNISTTLLNKRPELNFFEAQNKLLESQRASIYAGNMPKVGLFLQGGYGRPGLNMFSGNFESFYIGGIRLNWNLSGFYSQKNNLQKINLNKKNVDVQKETFLFNNSLTTTQQLNDIEKLKETMKNDEEIIRLRSNIKNASEIKVTNGTLTVTDLLRDINSESTAKQTKSLHEMQLYMISYQLKNNLND